MNDTEVSIKFKNQVTGEKKLEKYVEQLKTINACAKGMNTGSLKNLSSGADELKSISESTKTIAGAASVSKLSATVSIIKEVIGVIKKLGEVLVKTSKKSFDFLENFNLFQVAFNGNYKSAERFINKMSEMYGLDESWLTQTVGKFKQLTNAMNLTAETGEKVSKLLTQMSLDISSLYNIDIDKAAATLSSAMAGQTKPIRGATGADITQATLQTTLDNLGIDRAVSQLSFAEKRLLIIISLTEQLNGSIGDMARTIESPSNQLRIMNEQWERLTRAVGNVFLPILSKILPYLNAILMVLTEIISSLATLLGYSMEDYDYFSDTVGDAWDLDDALSSAGASAKKLKQGLRGFDKLNVITTPSAGGGGGGGGISGGLNSKLLDAFNKAFSDYQSKLSDVKMKATEIRDKIMEWLGFTKLVDEETGKVSFKFTGLKGDAKFLWEFGNAIQFFLMGFNWQILIDSVKTLWDFFAKPIAGKSTLIDQLSPENAARLKPVQQAFEKLRKTISTISYDNLALTKDEKKKILDSINGLTESLRVALDKYVAEQIKNLNYLYKEMGLITEEEYDKALKELEKFQKDEKKKIDEQGKNLKKTYEKIYDENGDIIIENYAEYLNELDKYEQQSYEKFTLGEADKSKVFKENLEGNKQNQIDHWSELLQGYAKDRDDAIEKAKEKKEATLKAAEELYGKESEIYQKTKKEAEKTYDEEKKAAEEKYKDIYGSFKRNQGDMANYIDRDTGKVLTKWQSFCKKIKDIWEKWTTLTISVSGSSGGPHISSSGRKAASGGIFTPNGQKYDIRRYAVGGLPPVGQMFVAREKGPELVGKIGNHSAVMNNDQIVGSVASGVYEAVYKANLNSKSSSSINPTIIVQVGNKEIAKQVITDLQDMAKTNGKSITIGG